MPINSGEYRPQIGLDSIWIAEVTQDDAEGYVAGTPEWLAPAAEASQEPTQNSETLYADDQAYEVMDSEGETAITLTITNLPLATLAKITGSVFDTASGQLYDNAGIPSYFALMFRSLKSNGSYQYFAFLKGRFNKPSKELATKGETPEPKLSEITYRAIKTVYEFDLGTLNDGVKVVVGDEDADNFDPTGWFDAVPTPPAASS